MNRLKKILIIIVLFFIVITVSACTPDNNGNNGNNNGSNEVALPDKNNPIKEATNEVIFISLNQSGQITSMKASNHLRHTTFAYYEQDGVFFNSGHSNITSGKGPIIIENNKALIPSLADNLNFFYTLALDHNYYIDLLPFKLNTKYRLNGYTVGYQSLKGASGRVQIEIEVTSNPNADTYFQDSFAAQIQVPINLNYAHIIKSDGAMANVITGTTSTLAYMIMPKTSTKIVIELEANNFRFDGIQAVYQPFNLGDFTSSFLDVDELGLDRLALLSSGLMRVISEFTSAANQLEPLFSGMEMMQEITNNEEISQIQALIDNITSSNFRLGYRQAQNSIKFSAPNRNELIHHYTSLADDLESTINLLNSTYTNLKNAIATLKPKVSKVATYPDKFTKMNSIITKLEQIKVIVSDIEALGELNIELLAQNKEMISTSFANIGLYNQEVQSLFQDLIIDMQPLPLHLESLATDNTSLQTIIDNIILFAQYISQFKELLITYCEAVRDGKQQNIFSSALDPLGIIDRFVKGVEEGDINNPSLLSALDMIIEGFQGLDFGAGLDISQFKKLYDIDPSTNIRQIDEIVLGFIKMNQALSIPYEGEEMSFYAGLQAIASASDLIKLIPVDLSTTTDTVSFLSPNNKPPLSLQFVIKQQGF